MKRGYLPVVILFILISALALILRQKFMDAGIDPWVLLGGNTVLFVITMISMTMNSAAMQHSNTQGFMRNVYGGFMIKFFLVIIAILLYVLLAKPINKPALFTCLGLYLFYTFFGTRTVLYHKKPDTDGSGKSGI